VRRGGRCEEEEVVRKMELWGGGSCVEERVAKRTREFEVEREL
jgi:hypothetical protein